MTRMSIDRIMASIVLIMICGYPLLVMIIGKVEEENKYLDEEDYDENN